ncbi:hypothetical protein BKA64DRAFT_702338 [Cadophora sp. MPI-SDFR-AT-0126]|nr:hypothetical protein BKA64DRAFT_702338 [Leotiomycetes sp. MPI-SDFR-AT-0126]
MAEVLGAFSAATALAKQCGEVIKFACDIYSKYQNPDEVKRQLVQIQRFADVCDLISKNRSLQTLAMESNLLACGVFVSEFQAILTKVKIGAADSKWIKLRKAFTAVMKEKEVKDLFANLEREKMNLLLCVGEIDTTLLNSIGYDIDELTRSLEGVAITIEEIAEGVQAIRLTTELLEERMISPLPREVEMTDRDFFEVPNRRVSYFVGREDVLRRIETGVSTGAGPQVFVLRGLGGQGKTQIALEHCRRVQKKGVRAVFWVDASSEESVKKSFQTISAKLKGSDQPAKGDPIPFILDTFRDWPGPWLMVFDNYDDVKSFDCLQDFFPDSDLGTIIVTTRSTAASHLASNLDNLIELDGLSEAESLDLLWKQCRLKQTAADLIPSKEIVSRLAYHPLAITQAGSYIGKQKIRLNQFMDHYNKRRDKIMKHTPQLSQYRRHLSRDEKETSLNVFTTWELSLQQLLETAESGKEKTDLLTLFAFFDCKDISEQLFSAYSERAQVWPAFYHWPVECLDPCLGDKYPDGQIMSGLNPDGVVLDGERQWDADNFVDILHDLLEMSLVQSWSRAEDEYCRLSLHPLIKDWIRLRSTDEETSRYALISSSVLRAVLEASQKQGSFDIPLSTQQVLLSHVDAYNENLAVLQDRGLVKLELWHENELDSTDEIVGKFLLQCGRYADYERIAKRLVDFSTTDLGSTLEATETLRWLGNLAVAYAAQGKLQLAEETWRQILGQRQEKLGSDHVDTLRSTSELAISLFDRGQFVEAEEFALAAAEAQERILGFESQDTLWSMNLLGMIYRKLNKYEECREVLERTLKGREKLLGPNDLETLDTIDLLGLLFKDLGDLEAAEKMMRRSFVGTEEILGKYHPMTLLSVNNLGLVLHFLGRLDEAEEMMRRAVEGGTKSRGREHYETLLSMWNLAKIMRDRKKYVDSQALWEEACEGFKRSLGPAHHRTVGCLQQYDELIEIIAEDTAARVAETMERS